MDIDSSIPDDSGPVTAQQPDGRSNTIREQESIALPHDCHNTENKADPDTENDNDGCQGHDDNPCTALRKEAAIYEELGERSRVAYCSKSIGEI
ncbi:hypothetical protein FRB95_005813 [Tulasnella sp. JGI-2019a]|nr:hypothetical protein FRB95_005813 [Tulasnella sp. JGI-2019a]